MTKKEYIERDKAIEALEEADSTFNISMGAFNFLSQLLSKIPAADVRPVVTCEECDWHVDCGYHYCNKWCQPCPDNADFYCAYGERPNCGADMRG